MTILEDIKNHIEGSTVDDHFDPILVDYANMAFSVLWQLGIGPSQAPFKITLNGNETWEQFSTDKNLEQAKEIVFRRVQLAFDPPQNGNAMEASKEILKEMEWRANDYADYKDSF